jgi:formylglycine-generating enzyme required for sulfatase activity
MLGRHQEGAFRSAPESWGRTMAREGLSFSAISEIHARQARIHRSSALGKCIRDLTLADSSKLIKLMDVLAKLAKAMVPAILGVVTLPLLCAASDKTAKPSPVLPAEHAADQQSLQNSRAAITAFLKGDHTALWVRLRRDSDPGVRSQLINSLAGSVPIRAVTQQIRRTPDEGERAALILSLGGYSDSSITSSQRQIIASLLLNLYRTDSDAEVHSAIDWLFRGTGRSHLSWNRRAVLEKIDREVEGRSAVGNAWSVVPEGLTMVLVHGAGAFEMGADLSEPRRSDDETPHPVSVPRTFAISSKEVTTAQFQAYLVASGRSAEWRDAVMKRFPVNPGGFWSYPERPQVALSWYDAAAFCNWLSREAGIPHDQWVYPDEIGPGMKMPVDYLHRTGYRLPTEAEWEISARAGTSTAHFFGNGVVLLDRYAWCLANSEGHSWPVGMLKPNPFGLFDVYGNAWEWLQDRRINYPKSAANTTIDMEDTELVITNDVARTRRGGSWSYDKKTTRSAHRGATTYFPDQRRDSVGFRVARTVARIPQPDGRSSR